ncbi:DUF3667 domain-containing protein [Aquimarina sp. ERC-38]|uniref:DUF3667 domain-containing protein n=1 Tax=Aquimarina sp. ERC-38 TaxID=2949996 RepID=UPI002247A238|nr:DUF3667 domain-containing protein [Aquimarina sp. ERC-38]UZO82386.1 DUF3667 domain-containing protein [Aquimarina sp. ERC-38]
MYCKNCDHLLHDNFCARCGQNAKVDRLNFPSFLTEISDSIFQLNRGFLYTIKELFTRPGHTIRDFIQGKRKNHFKPIAFVLTLSTIYFFVSQIFDNSTLIDDFITGYSDGGDEHRLKASSSSILNWLSNNYAYTTLLLLPLFSLASFISFNGFGQNYLEHMVINSYITGQQAIFYSLFMIMGVIIKNEDITVLLAVITCFLFNCWAFSQFYLDKKRIKVISRLIISYFLYIFFISVFLIVLTFGLIKNNRNRF